MGQTPSCTWRRYPDAQSWSECDATNAAVLAADPEAGGGCPDTMVGCLAAHAGFRVRRRCGEAVEAALLGDARAVFKSNKNQK